MPASAEIGAVGEFAASLHGAITRRQAARYGLTKNDVYALTVRGYFEEPAPGVLVVRGSPRTWHQRLRVAVLAGGDDALAIAESAARLHRCDGFEAADIVHVAVRRGGRVFAPGVVVSQTAGTYTREEVVEIDTIRCAGLARSACDVASLGARPLERMLDDFERRGASLAWLEQTATRLRRPGRAGIPLVLAEIDRRRAAGRVRDTWFEKLVEECLASPLLPPPVRQYEIRDAKGNVVARPDLAFPIVRVAIEAHSRRYHTGPRKELLDQRRDNRLAAIGWDVRYIGWEDATQTPSAVCRFIETVVARRAVDLRIDLRPFLTRRS